MAGFADIPTRKLVSIPQVEALALRSLSASSARVLERLTAVTSHRDQLLEEVMDQLRDNCFHFFRAGAG